MRRVYQREWFGIPFSSFTRGSSRKLARLYHRGQFWGWVRTREDYRQALTWAGYGGIRDGFVPTAAQETGPYWIEGRLP